MTHHDDETNEKDAALARELRALDGEQEEDGLYPASFMQELTDFTSWDEFKVRLAATPRPERTRFVASTTRFPSYEAMERAALERLAARKSST